MILKDTQRTWEKINEQNEKLTFNEVRKYKEEPKMKNITEVKDSLEGASSRLDDAEEWISKLKNRVRGNHPSNSEKIKKKQKELIWMT